MKEATLLKLMRKTDIAVHRALFVSLDSSWNFLSEGAPHTRLYFITSGSGFIETEHERIEMTEGNVYMIPAECRFRCGCERMEKIFFHITVPSVEKYDIFLKEGRIESIPCPISEMLELKNKLSAESYYDILYTKAYLLKTLTAFIEKISPSHFPIKKYSDTVSEIIDYVDMHTAVNLSVADISKALFISESKIRNVFKSEMNMTIGKYVDDMVFIKAKRLLSKEGSSIGSVSTELGFCDQFYFSRRFKERFGITPKKYKTANKLVGER